MLEITDIEKYENEFAEYHTKKIMSTIDFWEKVVYPERLRSGELKKNDTQYYNNFFERACDELNTSPEGTEKVLTENINNLGFKTARSKKSFMMNLDEMLLVGMKESPTVRKKVLAYIRALEKKIIQLLIKIAKLAKENERLAREREQIAWDAERAKDNQMTEYEYQRIEIAATADALERRVIGSSKDERFKEAVGLLREKDMTIAMLRSENRKLEYQINALKQH